jgi:hypothetical protein
LAAAEAADGADAAAADDDYEETPVCAVCQEAAGSDTTVLACSHQYHQVCIDEWLAQNDFCPVCRTPVLSVDASVGVASTLPPISRLRLSPQSFFYRPGSSPVNEAPILDSSIENEVQDDLLHLDWAVAMTPLPTEETPVQRTELANAEPARIDGVPANEVPLLTEETAPGVPAAPFPIGNEPGAVARAPASPLTIDREATEATDEPVAVARATAPPLTLGREATEATDEPVAVAVARATAQPLTIVREGTDEPVAVARVPASPLLGDEPGSASCLKRLRQPVRRPPGDVVAQAPLGNTGAPAGDRASLEVSEHSSVTAGPEVKRVCLVVDLCAEPAIEQDDTAGPAPAIAGPAPAIAGPAPAIFRPPQRQDEALLPPHSRPLTNVPNIVEDDLSGSGGSDMLQGFYFADEADALSELS